jgi:hypothetical protein
MVIFMQKVEMAGRSVAEKTAIKNIKWAESNPASKPEIHTSN